MSNLLETRRSLHAVAELLLAGPQYLAHGTIKLAVTPLGFATTREPVVEVVGGLLRCHGHDVVLDGRTIASVADEVGLDARSLLDVYTDGCGLDASHVLTIDASAAAEIQSAFASGAQALASLVPDQQPILRPEHFDVGITVNEVNSGVSPGDDFLPVPYAYVGPWKREGLTGPFWNAPFGAARPLTEIVDLPGFFAEGAALLAS